MLTTSKMHHPKSEVDRLYLPRTSGGRGLVQLELSPKTTTIGLNAYLTSNNKPLLQIVKYHEQRKTLYSATKGAAKFCKELGIPEISKDETEERETSKENGKTPWPAKTTRIFGGKDDAREAP